MESDFDLFNAAADDPTKNFSYFGRSGVWVLENEVTRLAIWAIKGPLPHLSFLNSMQTEPLAEKKDN